MFYSANTHAVKSKRKTVTPNDLFQALEDMELDDFVSELKESLEGMQGLEMYMQNFMWQSLIVHKNEWYTKVKNEL